MVRDFKNISRRVSQPVLVNWCTSWFWISLEFIIFLRMDEIKKPTKIKVIKDDALIKVDIGALFYARIKELLFWYGTQIPEEEFRKSMLELRTREPQNDFEYHLLTLLALVQEVEKKADEQGFMEEQEFIPPTVN
jgi:hypothetical protein